MASAPLTHSCRTCLFWRPSDDPLDAGFGPCKAAPPIADQLGNGMWPMTHFEDICGGYVRRGDAIKACAGEAGRVAA